MTKAKIYYDMPEKDYHASPGLSCSKLGDFLVSPYNYWFWNVNPNAPERYSSDAMTIGSAVHKIVLEGLDAFNDEYALNSQAIKKPTATQLKAKKPSPQTVEQIKAYEEFLQSVAGKIVLEQEDYKLVRRCYDAVTNHPEASKALEAMTHPEVSIFYEHKNFSMRSRLDGLTPNGIIDLKTTARSASSYAVRGSIEKYNYHIQAYLYSIAFEQAFGKKPDHFTFIFVEKSPPHHVGVYRLDESFIEKAQITTEGALNYMQWCIDVNIWPGLNNDQIAILEPYGKKETL